MIDFVEIIVFKINIRVSHTNNLNIYVFDCSTTYSIAFRFYCRSRQS